MAVYGVEPKLVIDCQDAGVGYEEGIEHDALDRRIDVVDGDEYLE